MCVSLYIYIWMKLKNMKNLWLKSQTKTNTYSKQTQTLKQTSNPTIEKNILQKKLLWLSLSSPWQSVCEESQIPSYGLPTLLPACKISRSGISRLLYQDSEGQQITGSSNGSLQLAISRGSSWLSLELVILWTSLASSKELYFTVWDSPV